ncbi:MAG TPA: cohesin domain-containing protein, partial [Bryobacteraceae bacterium]|nr:cohesin domain-containing protein [Bryobacteraceae bacterium]
MRTIRNFSVAALTALAVWFGTSTGTCLAGTLSVDAPSSAAVGDIFTVNVNIAGITDLYGFQFDLSFDPAILAAASSTEGPFLPTGGATFFIPGTIDNTG